MAKLKNLQRTHQFMQNQYAGVERAAFYERIILSILVCKVCKVANHISISSRENVEESCSLNAIGICEDTLLNSECDVLECVLGRREVGQGRFRTTRGIEKRNKTFEEPTKERTILAKRAL